MAAPKTAVPHFRAAPHPERRHRMVLRLRRDIVDQGRVAAAEQGRSLSNLIEVLLAKHVARGSDE